MAMPEPPVFDAEVRTWILAFNRLHRSRGSGMSGPNPLQISEMRHYAEMVDMPADGDEVIDMMQAMDGTWQEHLAEQQAESK